MIEIHGLVKKFGDFAALGPLGLSFGNERILTVIGASGCGKSTLLRLLAGLETPTRGQITLDGERIDGPHRRISVAFQEPRLMPWLSVAANVELAIWDWPAEARRAAVEAVLRKVSLTAFAQALPKQLSGGMAQRVGLARALVGNPRLLLLDEPFSALDPLTRVRMQDHLLEIVGDDGPNVLLITHDIEEAIVLSDRIVVLDGPPARVRRDLRIDLPRPRGRASAAFQEIKELLLADLLPDRIDAAHTVAA
ncbi:MAG: ABC transporter ATP-binding protein [Candidatus Dactylopiibacterium sp.]|nr:ABC transporter ATP-binding protein [Candidatus Dactylopiibacterium sp.]